MDNIRKKEGWQRIDGVMCYVCKLLGVWKYWNPEKGWKEDKRG